MAWELSWGDQGEVASVRDAGHLEELLREINRSAAQTRTMAELSHDDYGALSIGLGRLVSVATFSASLDPPYHVSVGENDRDDSPLVFFYGGHWTEFTGRNAIDVEDAIAAMRLFLETGRRPENLRWEEV